MVNAEKIIEVKQRPVIEWNLAKDVCLKDSPVILMATPAGGIFYGDGVSNNLFYPAVGGPGSHKILYRYGAGTVCFTEEQKQIMVIENCNRFGIPNAFTPNGDGLNDYFNIPKGVLRSISEFTIFNRWGETVFTANSFSKGWNGRYKSLDAPVGTYVYFISGIKEDGSKVRLKGSVTLLR
jgi:gliding motility-associated-like protein